MNAEVFEDWFKKIKNLIEPYSVIVMDNAPYYSRRLERVPSMQWKKLNIQNSSKGITLQETLIKRELIDLVGQIKKKSLHMPLTHMQGKKFLKCYVCPHITVN